MDAEPISSGALGTSSHQESMVQGMILDVLMLSKKDMKEERLKKYVNYLDLKIRWTPTP